MANKGARPWARSFSHATRPAVGSWIVRSAGVLVLLMLALGACGGGSPAADGPTPREAAYHERAGRAIAAFDAAFQPLRDPPEEGERYLEAIDEAGKAIKRAGRFLDAGEPPRAARAAHEGAVADLRRFGADLRAVARKDPDDPQTYAALEKVLTSRLLRRLNRNVRRLDELRLGPR